MERDTLTIKTPKQGHSIVIKTYLTGREKRKVLSVFTKEMKIELVGGQPKPEGMNASLVENYENSAINETVISIDGNIDDLINRILDMPSEDYEFTLKEIYKVVNVSAFEEKKTI